MQKKNSDSPKQKRLSLRAEADSALGQIISYLQSISPNEQELGRLARNYRATVSIKRLKYESLVPKVLAALGAIATVENLPQKFNLDLALLLPLGEYANRDELEKLLKEALKGFNFQSHPYRTHLRSLLWSKIRQKCRTQAV